MSKSHQLGDLQLAVLRGLWERGLAPTTAAATILRRMKDKELVGHRAGGRQCIYRTLIEEPEVRRDMAGNLEIWTRAPPQLPCSSA